MKLFFSPEYCSSRHGFDTTRKAGWIAESFIKRPMQNVELVKPKPLDLDLLNAVHHPDYVRAIQTGEPRALAESQGFTWDSGLWEMVLASNGGAVEAALTALKEGFAGSLSSGLHHAKYDRGNGFCTFNGLILAAVAALNTGIKRVLIFDFDAHCGGGTVQLIRHHGLGILHKDIAVDDHDRYKSSPGCYLTMVDQAEQYLDAVDATLEASEAQSIDLCLYNAGMDPFEGCEIGGLEGITHQTLLLRDAAVFDWCKHRNIPVAFVMAGGYIGPNLTQDDLVELHRSTIFEASQKALR